MPNGTTGTFQGWLSTLPSTNFLIFIGACLSILTILTLLVCLVLQIALQETVVRLTLLFDASLVTGGVVQFGVKRATTKPEVIAALAAAQQNGGVRTTEKTTEKTMEPVAPVVP